MTWWEKTVEYLFIRDYVSEAHMLSPLDGTPERAGDALFASGNKWILLEFKRDNSSIRDEEKKFTDFNEAKRSLYCRDDHHLIVYGYEVEGQIVLGCRTYFSEQAFEMWNYTARGVEQKEFGEYLETLLKYKKEPKNSPGGGGAASSFSAFSSVAVIVKSESDGKISCISLGDYQQIVIQRQSRATKRRAL